MNYAGKNGILIPYKPAIENETPQEAESRLIVNAEID